MSTQAAEIREDTKIIPPSQSGLPVSTQATAIEQSRAIAEVQAAVVVAQQVPRDMGAAWADMEAACARAGLARRAFYSVVNRGNGPSVHLARELARIFGNVQYGVHELRRDDQLGMSEIQAFAWDVEKNVRSTRTFQVPHARMKKIKGVQTRDPLVDLQDIYLNNQNIGARAVREAIFTVLPADFVDAAQDLCHKTLVDGEGTPLPERIGNMVRAFGEIGVSSEQLETKIGRKRSAWRPIDVAQMTVVYTSIQRGELTHEDAFPAKLITAAEVLSDEQAPVVASQPLVSTDTAQTPQETPRESPGTSTPPGEGGQQPDPLPAAGPAGGEPISPAAGRPPGPRCTPSQQATIHQHLSRLGVEELDERIWWCNRLAGLTDDDVIDAVKELRVGEAIKIIDTLSKTTDRDQLDQTLNQEPLIDPDSGDG